MATALASPRETSDKIDLIYPIGLLLQGFLKKEENKEVVVMLTEQVNDLCQLFLDELSVNSKPSDIVKMLAEDLRLSKVSIGFTLNDFGINTLCLTLDPLGQLNGTWVLDDDTYIPLAGNVTEYNDIMIYPAFIIGGLAKWLGLKLGYLTITRNCVSFGFTSGYGITFKYADLSQETIN